MLGKINQSVVFKCEAYQEYQMSNPKEPRVQIPIPSRPWEMVGTDLFQWGQSNCMLVDYSSLYIGIASYHWSITWGVKLSISKCKTLRVVHTYNIFHREYKIVNEALKTVESEKDLGVWFWLE